MSKYTWSRFGGYECSSKGDKRFSAFYARLNDGLSIEHHFQCFIKGYSSIEEGKGNPPLREMPIEESYRLYKELWRQYLDSKPWLWIELKNNVERYSNTVSDMFGTSKINQARALCDLLNERFTDNDFSGFEVLDLFKE